MPEHDPDTGHTPIPWRDREAPPTIDPLKDVEPRNPYWFEQPVQRFNGWSKRRKYGSVAAALAVTATLILVPNACDDGESSQNIDNTDIPADISSGSSNQQPNPVGLTLNTILANTQAQNNGTSTQFLTNSNPSILYSRDYSGRDLSFEKLEIDGDGCWRSTQYFGKPKSQAIFILRDQNEGFEYTSFEPTAKQLAELERVRENSRKLYAETGKPVAEAESLAHYSLLSMAASLGSEMCGDSSKRVEGPFLMEQINLVDQASFNGIERATANGKNDYDNHGLVVVSVLLGIVGIRFREPIAKFLKIK